MSQEKESRLRARREALVVGWNEWVAFPGLGIERMRAKIDTGARTTALHVENLERRGGAKVCFETVMTRPRGAARTIRVEARVIREGAVRSSFGRRQARLFIRARLIIGPVMRTIEVGLVDRGDMRFPLLIGRTALAGVLVDPTRSRLLGDR